MIYTFLDFETTGTYDNSDLVRVIEIGAIKVDGDTLQIIGELQSYIDPQEQISDWIINYTGISNATVDGKPTFSDFAPQLEAFARDTTLAAWPISFEWPVLQGEYRAMGKKASDHYNRRMLDIGTLCTYHANRAGISLPNYGLSDFCKHFNIDARKRHSALDDVKLELAVLDKCLPVPNDLRY